VTYEERIDGIRKRAYFETEMDKEELFDAFVDDIYWLLGENGQLLDGLRKAERETRLGDCYDVVCATLDGRG